MSFSSKYINISSHSTTIVKKYFLNEQLYVFLSKSNILSTILVHCWMQLQVTSNSILLMLEALLSLLKETKTIGKNLTKIRARKRGERANQREVTVDTGGGRRRQFATDRRADCRGGLWRQRERSWWEDQPQGKVAVEGEVRHRRINALWTSSSSASGALIP